MSSKPLHVACIMDGNGRWARKRGLPRTAGHTAGEESLADVVRAASKREVAYLTVFGFSTENWVRPRAEVRHILGLHKKLSIGLVAHSMNQARAPLYMCNEQFEKQSTKPRRILAWC
ncbi:MAG: undecaprenyl pyrophosphate synthetase [Actinomycetota bacterium]